MSELLQLSAEEFATALRRNKPIDEFALESLLWQLSDILAAEPNVIHLSSPVSVCGDVHGNFLTFCNSFTPQAMQFPLPTSSCSLATTLIAAIRQSRHLPIWPS
jgi:hypothetical protein